jgi:hypothetical protein
MPADDGRGRLPPGFDELAPALAEQLGQLDPRELRELLTGETGAGPDGAGDGARRNAGDGTGDDSGGSGARRADAHDRDDAVDDDGVAARRYVAGLREPYSSDDGEGDGDAVAYGPAVTGASRGGDRARRRRPRAAAGQRASSAAAVTSMMGAVGVSAAELRAALDDSDGEDDVMVDAPGGRAHVARQ